MAQVEPRIIVGVNSPTNWYAEHVLDVVPPFLPRVGELMHILGYSVDPLKVESILYKYDDAKNIVIYIYTRLV